MNALVFDGTLSLRTDYPTPEPSEGEALVRVHLAGVCNTDLEILKGYMGFRGVIGHEFVGVVERGPSPWVGKRVVGEINCPCRRCEYCKTGLGNHCPTRTVLGIVGRDGAFAEYLTLPAACLHDVPDGVSDEQAVFVEPLAAAFQIVKQVRIDAADKVVILGDGRLGQLVARVLKTVCRPVLVGKHEAKRRVASRAGVEVCPLARFTPAADADVVVDCTGKPEGFELAMRAVRPRGTIILKSTAADGRPLNLAPLVINEVTVVGSRCGPFEDAIAALATGQVEVADLIGKTFPLSHGLAALEAARDPMFVKVLIDMAGKP